MTLRVTLSLTILLLLSFVVVSRAQQPPPAPQAPRAPTAAQATLAPTASIPPPAPQSPQTAPAPPAAPPAAPSSAPPPPPQAALAPEAPFAPETFSFFYKGESFLGIFAEDVNNENMKRYGLSEARGVAVARVLEDSPAARAGIRKDDVIVRFNGEEVTSVQKLNRMISEVAPDHTARLTISRGGAEQEISVTVAKRESFPRSFQLTLPEGLDRLGDELGRLRDLPNREDFSFVFGANRRIGIGVSQLTKQLGEYFGVPGGRGALITSVREGGPAAKAGLKAGDVITAIDGKTIERVSDLTRELNRKGDGEVSLKIIRDKSERTIRITPERGADFDFVPEINIAPQVGQLSLPRLAMPVIPAIKIKSLPTIVLPALPKMDKIVVPRLPAIRIPRVLPVLL